MQTAKHLSWAGLLALALLIAPVSLAGPLSATGPGVGLLAMAPAYAMPVNPEGGKTMKDLQSDGYNCAWIPLSGGFYECKKAGSPTYWCSSATGSEQAPVRT
jgi:hypothetical protein